MRAKIGGVSMSPNLSACSQADKATPLVKCLTLNQRVRILKKVAFFACF